MSSFLMTPVTPSQTSFLNNVSGISDASPGIIIQSKESLVSVSPSIMKTLSNTINSLSQTDLSMSQLQSVTQPSSSSAASSAPSSPPTTTNTLSSAGISVTNKDGRRLSSISSVSHSNKHPSSSPSKPLPRSPLNPTHNKVLLVGGGGVHIPSTTSASTIHEDGGESIRSLSRSNYKEENDILQLRLQQATEEIKRLQSLASDRQITSLSFAQEMRESTDHDIQESTKHTALIIQEMNAVKRKMMYTEDKLQATLSERDTALEQIRLLRPQVLQAKLNAVKNTPAPHEMAVALLERWRALGGNASSPSSSSEKKYDPTNDVYSDAGESVRSTVSTIVHRSRNPSSVSGKNNKPVTSMAGRPNVSSFISPPVVHRRNDGPASIVGTVPTNNPAPVVDIKPIQVARLIAKWNTKSPLSSPSTAPVNPSLSSATSTTSSSPAVGTKSPFPNIHTNNGPVSPGALLGRQGFERALQAKVNVLMNELEYTTTKQVPSLVQHLTDVIANAQNLEMQLVQERHAKEETTIALQQAEILIVTLEKQLFQVRQRLDMVEQNASTAEVRAIQAEGMTGMDRLQQELALAKADASRLRQNEESLLIEINRLQQRNVPLSPGPTPPSVSRTPPSSHPSHSHGQPTPTSTSSPVNNHLNHQELEELRNRLILSSTQITELQEQLVKEQNTNTTLSTEYQELTRTNTELKDQLTKAHTKLDEAFTDLLRLETRVNEKEDNLAELTVTFSEERTLLRQQIDKLLQDREINSGYVNEEVKLLQQQYNELITNSNNEELILLKQIKELKEQYTFVRKQYITATNELNVRNIELIYVSSLNKHYHNRIQQLQTTIDTQHKTIEELKTTIGTKGQTEIILKRDIQALQETIKTFNQDLDQRNTTIRHLQEALADSAERIPKLNSNIYKLREKHEKDKGKIQKLITVLETERKFREELTPLLQSGKVNQEISTIMNLIHNYDTNNKLINEEIRRSSSPTSTK